MREIVIDGHNGRLVADEAAMARAAGRLGSIDPAACRDSVRSRYDIAIAADGYEAVYRCAAGLAPRVLVSQGRLPARLDLARTPIGPVPSQVS